MDLTRVEGQGGQTLPQLASARVSTPFDIVFVVHFQKKKINIKSLICSVEL